MSDLQKNIKLSASDLMNRELTRSDFLKYIGAALIGTLGFAAFFKHLHKIVPSNGSARAGQKGYGSGVYGR